MYKEGFNNVEILSENDTEFNNIKLYKTEVQHRKREIVEVLCKSVNLPYDAMGIIFKTNNEKTLYVAGDTMWYEEVETVFRG